MIYNEDCRKTLKRDIEYNYVLTSPPDYEELNIKPSTNEWEEFLDSWMGLLKPINNLPGFQYVPQEFRPKKMEIIVNEK